MNGNDSMITLSDLYLCGVDFGSGVFVGSDGEGENT
jgi:hypothetical protein